jgi:uncharacterized membrane protein
MSPRAPRLGIRRAGLIFVFLWFAVGGVAHFAATRLEMSIVPPLIPWPHAVVLVSGAFELLGAAGLLLPTNPPPRRAGDYSLSPSR